MKLKQLLIETIGKYIGVGKLNNQPVFILGIDQRGNYIIQFLNGLQLHNVRPKELILPKNHAQIF